MKAKKLFLSALLALVVAACNPVVQPTATPASSVRAGYWEGKPSVSFDVTAEGQIRNFKIVAPFGALAGQYCTVEADEVTVGAQGEFTIGEPSDAPVYIRAEFVDATTLSGIYKITLCPHGDSATVVLNPEEKSWQAQWVGKAETSTTEERPSPTPTAFVVTLTPLAIASPTPGPTSLPTWTVSAPPTHTPTPQPTSTPTPPPESWQSIPDLPRQINALLASPDNPQTLYAGTGASGAGSGVYKSVDAGLTWQRASDGLPNEDVRALAFSQGDPPTLYAAVGHRGDVFASSDGGQSWTRRGNYELTGFQARLAVAPGDGELLFAVEDVRGVYRSLDGGYNWAAVGEGLPRDKDGTVSAQALAIDPTDADVVYVGTGWGSFNGNGVYKSTDGGDTWAPSNRGMIDYGITALALHPANPQVIYAGGEGGELFRSADGGQTWDELSDRLPEQTSVQAIVIDPEMDETVYLLCERVGVLVSYDGGAQWRLLGKPGQLDYPSFTALVVSFGPPPVLLVGVRDKGGWHYAAD